MLGKSYRKEGSENRRGSTIDSVWPGARTTVVLGKLLGGTSWLHGIGTYRVSVHRETGCTGASRAHLEFQSSCAGAQSHWLKFRGCFFPAGQTCSSLPHLPTFLSFHKRLIVSIPGCLQSPPLLPFLLRASPSGSYSRVFHQAPLPIPHPRFFTHSWNWEAGKALRESIQLPPLTDEATWAPAAMWLAQGHSASWQESWDTNPRFLMTFNESDDAQMSTEGLQLWARIESKDLRPLPGSWQCIPSRQSGTHAWEGHFGALCQHI